MKKKISTILISLGIVFLLPMIVAAYYSDSEQAEVSLTASTLDTQIAPSSSSTLELVKGGTVSFITNITNIGKLTSTNSQILISSSNPTLANIVEMSVTAGSTLVYPMGSISGFSINNYLTLTSLQSTSLTYTFSISEADYDANPNSTLTIVIRNASWQQGIAIGTGFSDFEDISITLRNSTPASTTSSVARTSTFQNPADLLIDLGSTELE